MSTAAAEISRRLSEAQSIGEVEAAYQDARTLARSLPDPRNGLPLLEYANECLEEVRRWSDFPRFTAEEVSRRLQDEFGYSPREAELAEHWLMKRRNSVFEHFVRWWHTGNAGELARSGISLRDLVEKDGFTTVAALCLLQELPQSPEGVLDLIRTRRDPIRLMAEVEMEDV